MAQCNPSSPARFFKSLSEACRRDFLSSGSASVQRPLSARVAARSRAVGAALAEFFVCEVANGINSTETQIEEIGALRIEQFTNVTDKAGIKFVHYPGNKGIAIIREVFGPGLCVADFDGDGWQDIYFVNGRDLYGRGISASNAIYHNNGDGTFTDVTANAG